MKVFYLEYHERFYIQKLSFTKVKKKGHTLQALANNKSK